nr:uncharacterized protein LOC127339074 [Lolium perenne]
MEFKVTVTTRAATMEKWIYRVSEDFLCDASAKIVGLDCEFTDKVKGIKQKLLLEDKRQRAAVLQLCVANNIILFQIFQATKVPCLLKKFLSSGKIWFFGAAIDMDRRMLMPYGLTISLDNFLSYSSTGFNSGIDTSIAADRVQAASSIVVKGAGVQTGQQ